MNLEYQNPEESVETYKDNRDISRNEEMTNDLKNKERAEYNFEHELSKERLKDMEDINRLTEEATRAAKKENASSASKIEKILSSLPDGSEPWKDERKDEEKQTFEKEQKLKKVSGFRKIGLALGFFLAGLTGQAANTHSENYNDSTHTEKITQIENRQEINGINLEGMIKVPMDDTTANYYFLGFSGNPQDLNKIEKMKEAVQKLGYDLASSEELKLAIEKHGQKLIKATGGYGISLKDIALKVDDTQNPIINNVVEGPMTHILTTFNPLGQLNRYEVEAIEENNIQYSDYPVFVKQAKEKQQTADYHSGLNK